MENNSADQHHPAGIRARQGHAGASAGPSTMAESIRHDAFPAPPGKRGPQSNQRALMQRSKKIPPGPIGFASM